MRKMRTLREYLIERLVDKERAIGYLRAILDLTTIRFIGNGLWF